MLGVNTRLEERNGELGSERKISDPSHQKIPPFPPLQGDSTRLHRAVTILSLTRTLRSSFFNTVFSRGMSSLPQVTDFYINGKFVPSSSDESLAVIDPSTEKPIAMVKMANQADVDAAVRDTDTNMLL